MRAIVRAALLVAFVSLLVSAAPAGADSLAESSAYFALTPDPRLCPSPLCGGVFARRVNLAVTRCPDGKPRPVCHASEVDWILGVDGEDLARIQAAVLRGQGIVRGRLLRGRELPGGELAGRLVITEAWIGASSALADGDVFRVRDLGIVCVTAPCFSLHASTLNTTRHRDISELDLSGVGATEEADKALSTTSLLVSGHLRTVRSAHGDPGVELVATRFYLLAAPR